MTGDLRRLGPLRPTTRTRQPSNPWLDDLDVILPTADLISGKGFQSGTVQSWRLVEFTGGGPAVLCNQWQTPTMAAPAFWYYRTLQFTPALEGDEKIVPGTLIVELDRKTMAISLPISLAISLPDFPGENPPECRTCEHFETYYTQGIDNAPMDAGACLAGDRARPANGLNDSCELYAASSL